MTVPVPKFDIPPVFLSASVPLEYRDQKYHSTADRVAIRDAVVALATAVLPVTGLVFGGHPAITPLISAVAQRLSVFNGRVLLFQSGWFVKALPAHPGIQTVIVVPDEATREASLLRMREAMIESYSTFTAGVFIGGMDGVEQEFDAFALKHPKTMLLPVASTGAAAAIIKDTRRPQARSWPPELETDLAYLSLFRRFLGF